MIGLLQISIWKILGHDLGLHTEKIQLTLEMNVNENRTQKRIGAQLSTYKAPF